MAFDGQELRKIMGSFATGVTIVTTDSDPPTGLTANSVTSLSLDPPLILFAVDKKAGSLAAFNETRRFAVSILTTEQQDISNRFATPGPKDFSDLSIRTAETGAPILADALAWADCRVVDVLPGGDHDIFIGEVVAGDVNVGDPLLFYAGKYREVASPG
jgi:flavin reductase (DIM6/NTAB) family NADH-FMN oxidoreductase RutF